MASTETDTRAGEPRRELRIRGDLLAGAGSLALVAAAVLVGWTYSPVEVGAGAAPMFAIWLPHTASTTASVTAIALALAVVLAGPTLAARQRFGVLLAGGYAVAVAFTLALAMIDGWETGIKGRLEAFTEYLHEVPRITDIPSFVAGFAERIPIGVPGSWVTHVAGHPPGATLFFVWLDRLGFQQGGPAGIACVVVGALVAVAVPLTLRVTSGEDAARAAVPFLVLFPGAVWMGVSADAVFAGVGACGIALLALGTVGGSARHRVLALAGGVLLGYAVFCSYGLVLLGPLALGVVWWCSGSWRAGWRTLGFGLAGALAVLAAFTLAGFWWLDGYSTLVERYYQGLGDSRPFGYWVWANLACLVLVVGPLLGPALVRSVRAGLRGDLRARGVALVVAGGAVAVLAADLSGLSKAETERIWLPFAVWLVAGAALLPPASRRWWLAAQATTALLVNHLLLTSW